MPGHQGRGGSKFWCPVPRAPAMALRSWPCFVSPAAPTLPESRYSIKVQHMKTLYPTKPMQTSKGATSKPGQRKLVPSLCAPLANAVRRSSCPALLEEVAEFIQLCSNLLHRSFGIGHYLSKKHSGILALDQVPLPSRQAPWLQPGAPAPPPAPPRNAAGGIAAPPTGPPATPSCSPWTGSRHGSWNRSHR